MMGVGKADVGALGMVAVGEVIVGEAGSGGKEVNSSVQETRFELGLQVNRARASVGRRQDSGRQSRYSRAYISYL